MWVSSLTILYFGAELSLLSILKQRLVALDFIPRLTAWLIKQSTIPAWCRALDKRTRRQVRHWHDTKVSKEYWSTHWCIWLTDRTGVKDESVWRGEWGERKHLILPPDVKVKSDVRFDPQFVFFRWLKYTVVCTIIVLEEFTVQKPERQEDGELLINNALRTGSERRTGYI